jgi:SHS2 domain-containing protein
VYRWVRHTGEAALAIEAATEEQVFVEAATALCELLADDDAGAEPAGESARRRVALESADRPALLAEWLGELAFLAETDGFVADRVEALELDGGRLEATVAGRLGNPRHLVKAATYHGLSLAPHRAGWRATVVLDV